MKLFLNRGDQVVLVNNEDAGPTHTAVHIEIKSDAMMVTLYSRNHKKGEEKEVTYALKRGTINEVKPASTFARPPRRKRS